MLEAATKKVCNAVDKIKTTRPKELKNRAAVVPMMWTFLHNAGRIGGYDVQATPSALLTGNLTAIATCSIS